LAILEGQITKLGAMSRCDVKVRRMSTFLIYFSLDGGYATSVLVILYLQWLSLRENA
jgi:hypothetical protein